MATFPEITVEFLDGSAQVVPLTIGDFVRLERHTGIPAAEIDLQHPRLEHLLFLAHSGLRRTGGFEGDFEKFLDEVASAADSPKGA